MSTRLAAKLGYLAVGATSVAGGAAVSAARDIGRMPPVSGTAARLASSYRAVSRSRIAAPVVALFGGLEERGRAAVASSEAAAAGATDAAMARVARSDAVVRMVTDIVDRVLWPIVDEVIPVVLDRLAEDRAQVQAIVMGQSAGMASDLAEAARARAERADEQVASLVDRVLHRRSSPTKTLAPRPIGTLSP